MVDIDCEKCEVVLNDNFKITKCSSPSTGKPRDSIKIKATVKCLNKLFAGDVRLCLYQNDTLIGTSTQVTIQPGFSRNFIFGFLMPDSDISLNLSLLGQNVFSYDCEDYKDIFIEKSTKTTYPDSSNILIYAAIIVLLLIYMESR